MQEIELKIRKKHKKETESILFEFPLEWKELTLRQFIDWYEVTVNEQLNELERSIKMISILSSKSLAEIEQLNEKAFYQLLEVVSPLVEQGFPNIDFDAENYVEKEIMEVEINGEVYRWIPDYFKDSIGNISRMEQTLQGLNIISHFHYVLAFCMNKEGEEFDQAKLDDKAQMFLDELKMNEVYELLFFSLIKGKDSLSFIRGFSQAQGAEMRLQKELQNLRGLAGDGAGTTTE